ncbi:Arylsulfatase (plasmid) [Tautonia plasticadhaerens]|uniref:Arylsulfatase n=2 Tax=Tautonia plasticadhaerens TaxID=2527974 RepID=A0A518HE71_9BACT|nr:Arylsulfatase [Tautonia plasticadhaerens]
MVAALAMATFVAASPAADGGGIGPDERPNVVLIVADDLGHGDVGFNGRSEWATPHLDALASRGMVLRRFYASACVCGPSRAALMTGKSPGRCGVRGNADDLPAGEVTIAEALADRGYATALFGKWHRGAPAPGEAEAVHPLDQGFGAFFGFLDPYHAAEKYPASLWDGRDRVPSAGYADDLFTDRAVDFIGRHRSGPFLLVLACTAPHHAIVAPAEEVDRHRGRLPESEPGRPHNAHYAGMVTRLDRNVGRVLDALEGHGLSGRTLVVFTSDNGATFEEANLGASAALGSNGPLRGQKRTLWEGGIRVPTVVSWPGRIPTGAVSEAVGVQADLLPTALAAAGGEPDPSWGVEGVDLLPSWAGVGPGPDRTLTWEWRDEGADQRAALRGDLKLVVDRGTPALFDVAADPGERRDLSADRPGDVARLGRELLDRPGPGGLTGSDRRPYAKAPGLLGHQRSPRRASSGGKPPATPVSGDLAALQGRWSASTGPGGGTVVEWEVVNDRASFRVETPEGLTIRAVGSVVVDATADPPALDWVGFRTGAGLPLPPVPSIYRLDGEAFTVRAGGPNGARPTAFAPGDGPLADLVTFRRVVPGPLTASAPGAGLR